MGRVVPGAGSEWMHLNVSVELVWVGALRCIFFLFLLVKN